MQSQFHSKAQPTQPAPYHRKICGRLALFLAGFLLLIGTNQLWAAEQKAAATRPPMPVETLQVRVTTAEQKITAVGSLQSNESVLLSSEISGRVSRINFSEGAEVKADKLLIQLDDAVLKAQLDQARANLTLHEADYLRTETLLKDHAISQQERDTAYARWMLDKASLNLAEAQWLKTRILAPFSGTLGLRMISPGEYVEPGKPLVNLEDTRTLKVEFSIPEKYSASITNGQSFVLQSEAYAGKSFSGEIYAINPLVDAASRGLVVRGRLDNTDGQLRPGQFANLQLTIAAREDALFIPEQAVIPQPQSNLVYRVVDGKAEMVPVQLGQRIKGWVEVTSGLVEGDIVVTGGHQKIGPGSPVQAIPADPALFAKI
jgi:membrane fusion protein (multidrug efflux system)